MVKIDEPVTTGTTIVAIKYRDGVILGADSRTSSGMYIANRISNKLAQIDDLIMCCRSGSAADTQFCADQTKQYISYVKHHDAAPVSVLQAANYMKKWLYNYRAVLSAGVIMAGVDSTGGHVYSIPLGGMIRESSFAIGGSGSIFLYSYFDSSFKEDMTEQEGIEFVKAAVRMAIYRDGASGGVVRLGVINKQGVTRHVFHQKASMDKHLV